jgi:magnesium chelatase subunit D
MASDNLWGRLIFPFSAAVGNETVKKALMCALVSDDISSVLICGRKGTGKTLLARSITAIDPDKKIITLPKGSTEDQIFGGMDLEDTLKTGKRKCSDSILLRSDSNVLLLENINTMSEYLAYQILNVSSAHFNTVERDGISMTHSSDFLLIATMDPEEGDISDHLLDRFDVCVFTSNIDDESERKEVAKRCMEFELHSESFIDRFSKEDAAVRSSIASARMRSRYTGVPEGYCKAIYDICTELNVSGHRGDIAVMNAARAFAALSGRNEANLEDLKDAAAICLEHRRHDNPEDQPPPTPPEPQDNDNSESDNNTPDPPENDNSDIPDPPIPPQENNEQEKPEEEEIFAVGDPYDVIDYLPEKDFVSIKGRSGKRSDSLSEDRRGRCVGNRIPKGKVTDIALCASIRAAAPYQLSRDHSELAIVMKKDDMREKVRERKRGNRILFLVDGSGSIGAQKRMVAVKGAILSLLKDAYQKRDEIGMVVFRANSAEEVLPMTHSILRAYNLLSEIPTGGRTPLIHGILKSYDILKSTGSGGRSAIVILTDGRCNVTYTEGMKPIEEMISTAKSLSDSDIKFVVIDTETGMLRFGLALELCRSLNGTYLRLEELNSEYIANSVRMTMSI